MRERIILTILWSMGVVTLVLWHRPGRFRRVLDELAPQAVLERLRMVPVYYWSYRGRLKVRHIGAMAQDFYARFGVGDNPKRIYTVDALGVLFASIQALAELLDAQARRIDSLTTHPPAQEGQG